MAVAMPKGRGYRVRTDERAAYAQDELVLFTDGASGGDGVSVCQGAGVLFVGFVPALLADAVSGGDTGSVSHCFISQVENTCPSLAGILCECFFPVDYCESFTEG